MDQFDTKLKQQLCRREYLLEATYKDGHNPDQVQLCSSRKAVKEWVEYISGERAHVAIDDISRLLSDRPRREWKEWAVHPGTFLEVRRVRIRNIIPRHVFRTYSEVCKLENKREAHFIGELGGERDDFTYARGLYWRPPVGTEPYFPWTDTPQWPMYVRH